jgi:hypothetical protein
MTVGRELFCPEKEATVRLQPRVSVALCTYRGENYLLQQLQSIAQQTVLPDELVVCDDGSDDATVRIVQAFTANMPFEVRLHINEHNQGLTANFEQAMRMACGDLILLCDQDDLWMPEKIESLLWVGQQSRPCLALHDARFLVAGQIDDHETVLQHVIRATGTHKEHVYGCCTAMNRSFRDIALPIPALGWGYDGWLHTIADMMGVRHVQAKVLLHYRRHQSNLSSFATYGQTQGLWFSKWGRMWDKLRMLTGRGGGSVLSELHRKRQSAIMVEERLLSQGLGALPCCDSVRTIRLALDSRLKMLKLHQTWRWLPALWKLLSGGYQPFSGWKSFLVDVLAKSSACKHDAEGGRIA